MRQQQKHTPTNNNVAKIESTQAIMVPMVDNDGPEDSADAALAVAVLSVSFARDDTYEEAVAEGSSDTPEPESGQPQVSVP
jgi:hypothetical protein